MAIQNLMPGIVDQPDERLDLGGWPCLFAKLVAGSLGIGRALDQLDDLSIDASATIRPAST